MNISLVGAHTQRPRTSLLQMSNKKINVKSNLNNRHILPATRGGDRGDR